MINGRTNRRAFIAGLGSAAAWPRLVIGKPSSKVYRVGVLNPGTIQFSSDTGRLGAALIRGFTRRGYTIGGNVVFERRAAEWQVERFPRLVDELVASGVDVIVTVSFPAALAAKQRSTTVPVVALTAGDPVATGLVDSLARPGGNVTGLSDVATELSAKRLELLNEIVPQLRIVGILWNANDLSMTLRSQASEVGARSVGVTVQQLALREMGDFEAAFEKIRRAPPDALLVVDDIFTQQNRSRVFDFAVMQRLPAIYEYDLWVRGGGLMSYGPDLDEVYERGSGIADSILKGARPADLPIEQPTRFRFLINLKTAKALGLTVPASLLARADEVIE